MCILAAKAAGVASGFNRYMVECEYYFRTVQLYLQHGFNRYMVECEFATTTQGRHNRKVLIDTWWNVNSHSKYLHHFIYMF